MKTKFVDKNGKAKGKDIETFAGYIKYVDRAAAIRNENYERYNLFTNYTDGYMNNPEKTGGLFSADSDVLTPEQVSAIKDAFQRAYDNNGIMWQTVISFDNRFLAQLGIYDPATGVLDEHVLQEATRRMMAEALKREGMAHTAVWSAAIHYNTDNIHIHVAYTEPANTRPIKVYEGKEMPKGYFSAKTFRAMKSKVVNSLLENEYTLLDKLVREKFVAGKKNTITPADKKLRDLWYRIYDNLPEDKRQWFYNMSGIKHLRPLLDELTTKYLLENHRDAFSSFQKLLMHQQAIYKTAYGEQSHYNNYAQTKMLDLYTRMGNALLAEMRQFARSPYDFLYRGEKRHTGPSGRYVLGRIKKALDSTLNDAQHENEREHQKLEQSLQYGSSPEHY